MHLLPHPDVNAFYILGVHVIRNFMRIHDTGKSLDKLRTKINNEIKKARMIEEKRLKEVTM
jgi:hypothetical protein